jgi:transcriptional regulator with XRE-family HTH domain
MTALMPHFWKMRLSVRFRTPDPLGQGKGYSSNEAEEHSLRRTAHPWRCPEATLDLRLIAYEIGVAHSHLINAANGITAPSPQLRQKLSEFLDLPLAKLFTQEGGAIQRGPSPRRQDQPQVRKARVMNAYIRDALRQAGAEAGRKARADAGLPSRSKITKQFNVWLSC